MKTLNLHEERFGFDYSDGIVTNLVWRVRHDIMVRVFLRGTLPVIQLVDETV